MLIEHYLRTLQAHYHRIAILQIKPTVKLFVVLNFTTNFIFESNVMVHIIATASI